MPQNPYPSQTLKWKRILVFCVLSCLCFYLVTALFALIVQKNPKFETYFDLIGWGVLLLGAFTSGAAMLFLGLDGIWERVLSILFGLLLILGVALVLGTSVTDAFGALFRALIYVTGVLFSNLLCTFAKHKNASSKRRKKQLKRRKAAH